MEREKIVKIAIACEAGIALIAWGLAVIFEKPLLHGSSFSWQAISWGILTTVPLFIGLFCTHRSPWPFFLRLQHDVRRIIQLFCNCTPLDFAIISLLAGIGEEALFRGLMQRTLMDIINPWGAILLASIVFGLMHFLSWAYFVYATLIGIYLGLIFIASGNLYVVIIAHATYDFVALLYLMRVPPRTNSLQD